MSMEEKWQRLDYEYNYGMHDDDDDDDDYHGIELLDLDKIRGCCRCEERGGNQMVKFFKPKNLLWNFIELM